RHVLTRRELSAIRLRPLFGRSRRLILDPQQSRHGADKLIERDRPADIVEDRSQQITELRVLPLGDQSGGPRQKLFVARQLSKRLGGRLRSTSPRREAGDQRLLALAALAAGAPERQPRLPSKQILQAVPERVTARRPTAQPSVANTIGDSRRQPARVADRATVRLGAALLYFGQPSRQRLLRGVRLIRPGARVEAQLEANDASDHRLDVCLDQ